jgi:CRISPR-associated Cas5-like protein
MVDEPIILVHADGRRTPSAIQIGIPWQLGATYEAGNYESHCWGGARFFIVRSTYAVLPRSTVTSALASIRSPEQFTRI